MLSTLGRLGSVEPGLRAGEVLSSQLLTPPPPAVIYGHPTALDRPSSDPSAVLGAVWRTEAVTAPLVTGGRPGDITSLFPAQSQILSTPWLPVLQSFLAPDEMT